MATDPPSDSPPADQEALARLNVRASEAQLQRGAGAPALDLSARPEIAGRVLSRLFNAGHGLAVLRALAEEGFPLDAGALRHWLIELSTPLPVRQPERTEHLEEREEEREESLSEAALEPFGEQPRGDDEARERQSGGESGASEQGGSSIDLQNFENMRILHQVGGGALEDAADALDRRNMRGLLTGSKGKGELLNLKAFSPPSGRYRNGAEIAVGGSGRIRLAEDRQLSRRVIVKELRRGSAASPHAVRRFIDEARLTAQLEHPHIIPVHDLGLLENGTPFFTLKLVHGRSLKALIRAQRRGDHVLREAYPLLALLKVFRRVCSAVAFAHSRGVIHRDIKPSNIMVGDFGEVQLIDWGIARVLDGLAAAGSAPVFGTSLSEEADGIISGTPSYMAPEQARGARDELGPRADIHALGATLYEILTGRPPFRGREADEILEKVLRDRPVPPKDFRSSEPLAEQLCALCLSCLAKEAEERPASVDLITTTLEQLIGAMEEQEQRRENARGELELGVICLRKYEALRSKLTALRDERLVLKWRLEPYAPLEEKRRLWSLDASIEGVQIESSRLYSEAALRLSSAVTFDPSWELVREHLAELYSARLEDAEERGEQELILYCRSMLKHYAQGEQRFHEQLLRRGRLELRSVQPSVVYGAQFIEVDLCLHALKESLLGSTPLQSELLPEGGWRLRFSAPGYRDSIASVWVQRDVMTTLSVRLFREEELGSFVYIPAGRAWVGLGQRGGEGRELELSDYLISAYPVSCEEYLLFLNTLEEGSPGEAARHAPRREEGTPLWPPGDGVRFALPDESDRRRPVHGISFNDARRYCEWYTLYYRRAVRLPTESEWEKAGRGAEGRLYPWGDHFDESFCCHSIARRLDAPSAPEAHPLDRSLYGVLGLAGGVQEFCDTSPHQGSTHRLLKGGSFQSSHPLMCRLVHREIVTRDQPHWGAGFRIVSSLRRG